MVIDVIGSKTCDEFKHIIHQYIGQTASASMAWDQTIYLYVNNTTIPRSGALM